MDLDKLKEWEIRVAKRLLLERRIPCGKHPEPWSAWPQSVHCGEHGYLCSDCPQGGGDSDHGQRAIPGAAPSSFPAVGTEGAGGVGGRPAAGPKNPLGAALFQVSALRHMREAPGARRLGSSALFVQGHRPAAQ